MNYAALLSIYMEARHIFRCDFCHPHGKTDAQNEYSAENESSVQKKQ